MEIVSEDNIFEYVKVFGEFGGILYIIDISLNFFKRWRNRNRILIRDFEVDNTLIRILVENLGAESNSVKNEIKINGVTCERKFLSMRPKIVFNSEVYLPQNKPTEIKVNL